MNLMIGVNDQLAIYVYISRNSADMKERKLHN